MDDRKEEQENIEAVLKEIQEPAAETPEEAASEEKAPKKKKRSRGKIVILILLALLVLLAGYRILTNFILNDEEAPATTVNVKVTTAALGEIYVESPIAAKVQAIEEVPVVPMAAGQVTSVNVKVGDYVKKGAVLFKIDDTQAQVSLTQATEGLRLAKATYDRMQFLYNEGAVSQQDYESARASYVNAETGYSAAVEAAGYYTVTAPISGYVTTLDVTVGSIAGQAMAAAVADTSQLVVKTSVTENMVGKINPGDVVEVYVSTLDKIFEGTVTAFSKAPSMGKITYPLTIALNDPDKELIAGMFAEVRIRSDQKESALLVPSDAVIIKNGESVVVTLDGTMPVMNTVATGIDNGEQVEIVSGIRAGDVVVIAGQHYVKEGEAVRIAE